MTFTVTIFSITLILLFSISPSSATRDDEHTNLNILCDKTGDRQLCIDTLRSDARSIFANNRRLTEIAIELAFTRSKDIHDDYNKLSQNTSDSNLRDRYESCSKNYNDVIRDFEQAKKLFSKSDYRRIRVQVKDAAQEVNACKDEFNGSWWSGSAEFQNKNREFVIFVDVVKVFVEEVVARNW